jgi:hypothetical protein
MGHQTVIDSVISGWSATLTLPTQMLLEPGKPWCGTEKSKYLETLVQQWGWEVTSQSAQLDWTFNRGKDVPGLAFLGFDNFDANVSLLTEVSAGSLKEGSGLR